MVSASAWSQDLELVDIDKKQNMYFSSIILKIRIRFLKIEKDYSLLLLVWME